MYQSDTINLGAVWARVPGRLVSGGAGQFLEFENAKQTPPARKIPFAIARIDPSDNIYNPAKTTTRF
jgi:hypothetical protein